MAQEDLVDVVGNHSSYNNLNGLNPALINFPPAAAQRNSRLEKHVQQSAFRPVFQHFCPNADSSAIITTSSAIPINRDQLVNFESSQHSAILMKDPRSREQSIEMSIGSSAASSRDHSFDRSSLLEAAARSYHMNQQSPPLDFGSLKGGRSYSELEFSMAASRSSSMASNSSSRFSSKNRLSAGSIGSSADINNSFGSSGQLNSSLESSRDISSSFVSSKDLSNSLGSSGQLNSSFGSTGQLNSSLGSAGDLNISSSSPASSSLSADLMGSAESLTDLYNMNGTASTTSTFSPMISTGRKTIFF